MQVADDPSTATDLLDRYHCDVIVVSHAAHQSETISALDIGLALATDSPVLVVTDQDDEQLTQRILAVGAVECLDASDLGPQQLERALRRAVARYRSMDRDNPAHPPVAPSPASERTVPYAPPQPPHPAAHSPPFPSPFPADVPKRRSTGGILIAVGLLVVVGVGVHRVWTAFFRYHAYGVVVGREIDISAPWQGQIKYMHVEENQTIRQGDLLATIEDPALLHPCKS